MKVQVQNVTLSFLKDINYLEKNPLYNYVYKHEMLR